MRLRIPLAVATAAVATLAVPATAAYATGTPAPACKSASSTIVDRVDTSFGGDWALDSFKRTVEICTAQTGAVDSLISYTATVTDAGTFKTTEGAKSPNKAEPITGVVTGRMAGVFKATFKAAPGFLTYKAALDGKTYTGNADGPRSSEWVKAMWGSPDYVGVENMFDWTWSFWTCSDKLADAAEHWTNGDTSANHAINDGDITGAVACPTTVPTTAPGSGNGGNGGGQPAASTPAASLPVTGANAGLIGMAAALLVAVGAAIMMVLRRRRTQFEA